MLSRFKKYGIMFATCVAALLIMGYVVIAWYLPRHISKSLNFQAYAPTILPTGVRTTGHTTTIHYGGTAKYVAFNTNTPGFRVSEQKMSISDFDGTYGPCNFNRTTNYCTSQHSAHGQSYSVLTTTDDSHTPTIQTVSWYRHGTALEIDLSDAQSQKYTPSSWGHIIDSFKPVGYGSEQGMFVSDNGG